MSFQIINADVFEGLSQLVDNSVHCCITSPPYWALRNYEIPPRGWPDGTVSAYGNEATPDLYVDHSVLIFREVRRVLRHDGVLWLNLGETYFQGNGVRYKGEFRGKHQYVGNSIPTDASNRKMNSRTARELGLKPGDACNIPHMVAAALHRDGWFWRSTIVWSKPNPMPESQSGWRWVRCRRATGRRIDVSGQGLTSWDMSDGSHGPPGAYRDQKKTLAEWEPCPGCAKCEVNGGYVLKKGRWRPTNSHEYVFLFSKSKSYFCDGDAIREMCSGTAHPRGSGLGKKAKVTDQSTGVKANASFSAAVNELTETRNPRSVWSFGTMGFKGAHFATFPESIPKRCVEASAANQCCANCGAPHAPVVDSTRLATRPGTNSKAICKLQVAKERQISTSNPNYPNLIGNRDPQRHIALTQVVGYRPTCDCQCDDTIPAVVLDPFSGSGTTGQVAHALGRHAILIEVNPEYVSLIEQRVQTPLRSTKIKKARAKRAPLNGQKTLF